MVDFVFARNSDANTQALEAHAISAGSALACFYASAAEYDAALIAERRAAGVYGPKRHRKWILAVLAGITVALAFLIFKSFN